MIIFGYLILSCLLSVELLVRLKFITFVNSIFRNSNKVFLIIISSKISDHWKERMVPVYAFIILKNSLSILVILCLVLLIFFLFFILSNEFLLLLLSIKGVFSAVLISYVYIKLKAFFL